MIMLTTTHYSSHAQELLASGSPKSVDPKPSSSRRRSSSLTGHYAFILWGEGFDAPAATIFTAAFRQQGVATKIVAMQGKTSIGSNGIQLHADLTLGEALAMEGSALAYILPCTVGQLARIENDPRTSLLFQAKTNPSTHLVLQTLELMHRPSLASLPVLSHQISVYQDTANLSQVANQVVHSILQVNR